MHFTFVINIRTPFTAAVRVVPMVVLWYNASL